MQYKKLWFALAAVVILSFGVLGSVGVKIISNAPPIPERVVSTDGRVVVDAGEIQRGTECLAVPRRPGDRIDLGARQLRRSGLDGRLAPPRSDVHPRPLGQRRGRAWPTRALRRAAGALRGAAHRTSCGPTPTTRDADDHDRSRPCGRVRGHRSALRRRFRQRALGVRNSARSAHRSDESA